MIPIVSVNISPFDLFKSIFKRSYTPEEFLSLLKSYSSRDYLFLINSGKSAFYLILEALKKKYNKKEVILPAYTASVLVNVVLKSGLKPVFSDISLEDFNFDLDDLSSRVNSNTLCIVPTHLFGIPQNRIQNFKELFSGTAIVEDCAQAMGSRVNNVLVGSFSDIGFLSFSRGKNFSLYSGGCIFTSDEELKYLIEEEFRKVKDETFGYEISLFFKILLLYFFTKPFIYGLFYPLLSKVRQIPYSEDFSCKKFTRLQSRLGLYTFKKIQSLNEQRYYNAKILMDSLKDIDAIITPCIPDNVKPIFNRFPLVFKKTSLKEKVKKILKRNGFDVSGMYPKPLHHIFDLGYKKNDFPKACFLADNLLVLPIHHLVREKDLFRIIKLVKKAL